MPATSTLMPKGSTNVIETSNSLLPSQRRMDMDTASPLAQPVVSWAVIVSLVILSTGGLIYACISSRKQHSFRVKLPSIITCSRCRYFNDNHFLKCALHPVTVMTEQAVDCIDYCPKNKEKWAIN